MKFDGVEKLLEILDILVIFVLGFGLGFLIGMMVREEGVIDDD